jgi:hypothetical protein
MTLALIYWSDEINDAVTGVICSTLSTRIDSDDHHWKTIEFISAHQSKFMKKVIE